MDVNPYLMFLLLTQEQKVEFKHTGFPQLILTSLLYWKRFWVLSVCV